MRAELLDNPTKRQGPCGGRRRMRTPKVRFSGELRKAWERTGADLDDPIVRSLIERGAPPVAGAMPTGMDGAAFMSNLPPEGTYVMDSGLFFENTERNDVPQQVVAYPGFGGAPIDIRIANVGVLSGIQVIVEGTLKTSGAKGTITPTFRWPWGLLAGTAVNANGQTSLIAPTGLDMRARHSRIYRNPIDPITTAPSVDERGNPTLKEIKTGEEFPVFLIYEVPIVHDWFTLTGSFFAQSDQIYLSLHLTTPAASELFVTTEEAKVEFTKANIRLTNTFFDVPYAPTNQGRKVLVPDLQWLHGFIATDLAFANTGDVPVPLIRTSGELLAFYSYIRNGGNAIVKPSALTNLRMEYGANRIPRNYEPPQHLLYKNADDYNGLILPEVGYFVLDFEADNPSRDLVFPKGVTELKVTPNIPATVKIEPSSAVHFAEEALFSGR